MDKIIVKNGKTFSITAGSKAVKHLRFALVEADDLSAGDGVGGRTFVRGGRVNVYVITKIQGEDIPNSVILFTVVHELLHVPTVLEESGYDHEDAVGSVSKTVIDVLNWIARVRGISIDILFGEIAKSPVSKILREFVDKMTVTFKTNEQGGQSAS